MQKGVEEPQKQPEPEIVTGTETKTEHKQQKKDVQPYHVPPVVEEDVFTRAQCLQLYGCAAGETAGLITTWAWQGWKVLSGGPLKWCEYVCCGAAVFSFLLLIGGKDRDAADSEAKHSNKKSRSAANLFCAVSFVGEVAGEAITLPPPANWVVPLVNIGCCLPCTLYGCYKGYQEGSPETNPLLPKDKSGTGQSAVCTTVPPPVARMDKGASTGPIN